MVGLSQVGAPVERAVEAVETVQRTAAEATVPRRVALARGRIGLLVASLAFLGFVGIFALVRANRSGAIDVGITMKLQRRRWPWLARLMAVASWPGFPPQSWAIPPTIVAMIWALGFRLEAGFQLLAWGTALLSSFVKAIMKRPRPNHPDIRVVVAPLGGSSLAAPAAEVEDDGGRDDRDGRDRRLVADPSSFQPSHHAVGRCETERAPSRQQDGMHLGELSGGMQGLQLARPRG